MKVVCVGDCGVDHYLPANDKLVGGISANVARHARTQFLAGDEIVLVSCVGNDENAGRVLRAFDDTGIECLWEELTGKTPVQLIEVEADGEKRFVGYDAGVLADLHFSKEQLTAISTSELLVAPVYLQIVGLYAELMAIETRGLVAIDYADFLAHPDFSLLEEHIEHVDIGFFGLTPDHTQEINRIASLAAQHNKLFVVTLGAAGSLAFHGPSRLECAAVSVDRVLDTTGAGDAYAAAFLAGYCHGQPVNEAMQRGAEVAATVVTQQGSYPAYDEAKED